MLLPDVVHPKIFKFKGVYFQLIAYCKMTDAQALKALKFHLQDHKYKKPKKVDQEKLIKVLITLDEQDLGLL